jgi:hypothetical protein
MSITKLKTVGRWHTARWRDAATEEGQESFRGRVITGMLTGSEAISEDTVAPDPCAERAR